MWNRRKFLAISLPALSAGRGWGENLGEAPLRFGVIADPQYADKAAKGSRHYRESLKKLRACIAELNSYDLEFTVTLGDLIDQDLASFEPVLSCYEKLKSQHRVVLGNHDFSVADEDKGKVLSVLGLERGYESFENGGWRFLLLDGTAESVYRYSASDPRKKSFSKHFAELKASGIKNAKFSNGGLGKAQLAWLEEELSAAAQAGERVVVCNHYPVMPANKGYNLWDAQEVVALIRKHPQVALYLNGHNHAGNYTHEGHCHYVNLKGMVETVTDSAFAVVSCWADRITIEGFGTEETRENLKG